MTVETHEPGRSLREQIIDLLWGIYDIPREQHEFTADAILAKLSDAPQALPGDVELVGELRAESAGFHPGPVSRMLDRAADRLEALSRGEDWK